MTLIDNAINPGPPGATLGACLLANDLPFQGQAAKILQMRIDGRSWKEIGDEFGKSPSGARKLFTDLTGIKDYKVKGAELKKLVNTDLDSLKVAKPKVPKKAQTVDDIVEQSKIGPDDFKVSLDQLDDDLSGLIADIKSKLPSDKNATKVYNEVIDRASKGEGYLSISKNTGLSIADVDRIVWQDLLYKNNGNVWKAWQAKKTSQEGIKAVTEKVMQARANGATLAEISNASGIPKDVLEKILKGDWKPSPFASPLPGAPGFKPPGKPHPNPTGTPTKPPLGAGQPPPPGGYITDPIYGSSQYPMLDSVAMNAMNPATLTAAEREAIRRYSGSYYTSVNSYLRTGQPSSAASTVRALDSAMAKARTVKPMTVTRGMNQNGFNLGFIDDMKSLKGSTMRDPGFMSTSNAREGVFHNTVRLEIECPPGTRGIYIKGMSSHSHENEFLMDRNQSMIITEVIQLPPPRLPGNPGWLVKARVLV